MSEDAGNVKKIGNDKYIEHSLPVGNFPYDKKYLEITEHQTILKGLITNDKAPPEERIYFTC